MDMEKLRHMSEFLCWLFFAAAFFRDQVVAPADGSLRKQALVAGFLAVYEFRADLPEPIFGWVIKASRAADPHAERFGYVLAEDRKLSEKIGTAETAVYFACGKRLRNKADGIRAEPSHDVFEVFFARFNGDNVAVILSLRICFGGKITDGTIRSADSFRA